MLYTCAWAASTLGMRTIWLLRGEAPSSPTLEQLNESDAVVTNLASAPHGRRDEHRNNRQGDNQPSLTS
jgi:FMN phosphatase YigB (HAD superfamily)